MPAVVVHAATIRGEEVPSPNNVGGEGGCTRATTACNCTGGGRHGLTACTIECARPLRTDKRKSETETEAPRPAVAPLRASTQPSLPPPPLGKVMVNAS
eukprot:scaffold16840_cov152-Isochrysis_galbana.AAC.2